MEYDVSVIGGGPGGTACAIKCASLGLKTLIVENNFPGGDAINDGYFPLKVLLSVDDSFLADCDNVLGDRIKKASLAWQDKLANNGVKTIEGTARIINENKIEIDSAFNTQKIYTKYLVIATGNSPVSPIEKIEVDGEGFISYRHAIKESKSGKIFGEKIAILGGDVEGCEFATFFNSKGKDVTVFETQNNIMPLCDRETREYLHESFVSQGIKVRTRTKVVDCRYIKNNKVKNDNENVKVNIVFEDEGFEQFDRVLMTGLSVPSLPEGALNLVNLKEDGFLEVDSYLKTSRDNVFALGDVIGGVTSANAAILEGRTVAVNIGGRENDVGMKAKIDYSTMPYVFFTKPQISAVGLRESDAKEEDIPYRVGKLNFSYNLRAQSLGLDSGFVKVLVNPVEDRILGVHIIGDNIAEMIALPVLIFSKGISPDEISSLPLPHPTMGEIILEAIEEAKK